MFPGSPGRIPAQCFYADCESLRLALGSLDLGRCRRLLRRKGCFFRSSDSKFVQRFSCRVCRRSFSQASFSDAFGQKRRRLNAPIRAALVNGMTQRGIARVLGTNPKTVARKFVFLAEQARRRNELFVAGLKGIQAIQFDEMESSEHTKCKPLSIPLVVDPSNRKVLGFGVCEMPAKGLLAQISRKKYGPRKDERPQAANELLMRIKPALSQAPHILTDKNPRYPGWIKPHWPESTHETTKGRRGVIAGFGELKEGGFDPLFALNHTAAMFRSNVSRLQRRTWCTTKKRDRLRMHLELYVESHNSVMT